ncbi:MAG: TrkA family potassium uptake protein [Microcystaceae cyanobacterium]
MTNTPSIIVCGLGNTGYKIFCLLKQQGAKVIGISDRPLNSEYNDSIKVGNLRSPAILHQAGVQFAQTLVLANKDDAINLAVLTQAKILNPKIRIINRLLNPSLGQRLDYTLTDHVSMSVSTLAAPIFAFAAMGSQAIGQLNLFNQTWPLQDIIITEDHPWFRLKLSDLWESSSRMLIYYLPAQGEMDLVSAVRQGKELQQGDHLIVGIKPMIRSRRRSLWNKFSKAITNLRRYHHYARPVALVSLLLLILIFCATFTYVLVNYQISLVDALYFSVGMITGAGGKEEVAEAAPDGIKIFTAIMMILGAGVIGICYALLNDFILGSRFKQFLDAAKVPTRHHYIICGLGSIGMEIARLLHNHGHEVVVIEADHQNRFLHTARSLGIPAIVEDGSLAATLKAANLQQAAAIVVVTSNDMVNVEIGLTAKAIAPRLPVILRSQDSQMGQSIQEVFDFDTVLCATELATPSFAAAALGGRILGNGMTDDLLWIALATLITPKHPFFGKTVQDAAQEADFVPLYLERNGYTVHSWQLLQTSLGQGDVLYLTLTASGLEKLWRVGENDQSLGNKPSLI